MLHPLTMVSSAHYSVRSLLVTLTILALARNPAALAGPPLVVDDPVTLQRGQSEIFPSFQFTRNGTLRTCEAPT